MQETSAAPNIGELIFEISDLAERSTDFYVRTR